MVLASFRYRTTEGLVLLLPESADMLVPWSSIEETTLDLKEGVVRVRFKDDYAASQRWLRGATLLVGAWTDRLVMTKPPREAEHGRQLLGRYFS